MNTKKIYSILGFAARSRKLVFGKERLRAYMRSDREKKLVIVAKDASERLKKDLEMRTSRGARIIELFTKKEIGKLLNKEEISAVGIEDDAMIEGIEKYMKE
jgi:ribosomal protein L7Ae-like RNA K-turn-binding protein